MYTPTQSKGHIHENKKEEAGELKDQWLFKKAPQSFVFYVA